MAESDYLDDAELEETFNKAAKYLQTLTLELDSEQLLGFYGLYKQATVGPCNIPRPNWYQTQAKYKWEAWKRLGEMSREIAMDNYVRAIAKVNPSWETDMVTQSHAWIAVSRLPNLEAKLSDMEKTIFDWVKEGNEKKVRDILIKDRTLVDIADESGLLLIHWAADRGHVIILECLIQNGANVNSRDEDGQTPLHYAASCGHQDVVKYLLSIGAESVEDNNGMKPKDVADEQLAAIL